MKKKKILFCNESSLLSTGFSNYGFELLSRLQASNKYEIAELAAFSDGTHPDIPSLPWKHFTVKPKDNDEEAMKIYNSKPTFAWGEFKFDEVCLQFKPDIVLDIRDEWNCLANPDDLLFVKNNIKSVKEIDIKDELLTHNGNYQKIKNILTRKYSGRIYKIKASFMPFGLSLTPEHPILAIKRKTKNLPNFAKSKLNWINAEKVNVGDIVCFPKHKCNKTITGDLARLLGYYTAEGCMMYEDLKIYDKLKGVQFTLCIDEVYIYEDIKEICEKLFKLTPTLTIDKIKNCLTVRVFNSDFAKMIRGLCPGLAKTKYLTKFTEIEEKEFLRGYLRGDGHLNLDGLYIAASSCTSSKKLAMQIFQMCVNINILPSVCYAKNSLNGKTFYKYCFSFISKDNIKNYGKILNGDFSEEFKHKRIDEKYAYLTITDVDISNVKEIDVFNFEVEEDKSFTSYFTIHNCEFESRSPARPYFNWVISPPVDSAPQKEEWIATFCNADKVLPYTDWGFNVLREEANQKINLFKTASPGVNLDNFKFTNSNEAKQKIGLNPEMFIIGTVMRNQIRKLYPDLIQSFAKFLEVAPENVASRSYLYLHTAYPDVGWDIPCLIKEHGVSHRTMMTYYCLSCREIFPSLFQDGLAICKYCGNNTAILPNIKHGIPHKVLSTVMSIFDCYVQYATNEGFGIPMVEAAACGVPVFAVDYSAMSEVVRNLHGFPVEVKTFFRDQGTMSYRAYPDNDDFIKKLIKFAQMPFSMRARIGAKARKAVEDRYTWEHNFKVWEECFDSIDTSVNKWAFPANYFTPQKIIPKGLSNPQFVRWGFEHVAGRPDLVNTHLALGTLRDLNLGLAFSKLDREQCMNHFTNLCNQRNIFEQRRCDENSIYSSL